MTAAELQLFRRNFVFMSALFDSAKFVMSVSELDGLPDTDLPEIAFAGRSNAGKSTAINVLTRQVRLAFSSKTPGRTQLLNFFELSVKGLKPRERKPVGFFVDLPGYGFAKASPETRKNWEGLVGGYVQQRPQLTGMVVVMDARRPFMPADEFLLDFISFRPELKLHFLLNKADQLKNMERRAALNIAQKRAAEIGPQVSVQLFSGLKKEGVEQLQKVLSGWLNQPYP
jgi:ribosome biogenesis GTP-binding protein YsxC/EngB